jgi:hypothetical protein
MFLCFYVSRYFSISLTLLNVSMFLLFLPFSLSLTLSLSFFLSFLSISHSLFLNSLSNSLFLCSLFLWVCIFICLSVCLSITMHLFTYINEVCDISLSSNSQKIQNTSSLHLTQKSVNLSESESVMDDDAIKIFAV